MQSELQGIPQRNEESKGAFERPTAPRALIARQPEVARAACRRPVATPCASPPTVLAKHPVLEAAVLDNPEVQDDVVATCCPIRCAPERAKETPSSAATCFAHRADQHPGRLYDWKKQRIEFFSKNNIYLAEFYDRTLVGVAFNELLSKRVTSSVAELKDEAAPEVQPTTSVHR